MCSYLPLEEKDSAQETKASVVGPAWTWSFAEVSAQMDLEHAKNVLRSGYKVFTRQKKKIPLQKIFVWAYNRSEAMSHALHREQAARWNSMGNLHPDFPFNQRQTKQ